MLIVQRRRIACITPPAFFESNEMIFAMLVSPPPATAGAMVKGTARAILQVIDCGMFKTLGSGRFTSSGGDTVGGLTQFFRGGYRGLNADCRMPPFSSSEVGRGGDGRSAPDPRWLRPCRHTSAPISSPP